MDITSIIAVLGAMSLSVERVVEIVKGMIPFLAVENADKQKESLRRVVIQIFSVVVGFVIALVAQEQIQPLLANIFKTQGSVGIVGCIILGLLASGGSGFWNQSMRIVEEIKKAKKLENIRP